MPVTQKAGTLLLVEGLDTSNPAEYISEQSSPSNQNFTVKSGVLTKRDGTTVVGTTMGEEIMRGTEFTRAGTKYNVRIGLTTVEHFTGGTWTDITGSALTGTTSDVIDVAIPLLGGKRILCITNNVDNIRKWTATGNTADLGGTPPVCKYIKEYKTYLVCANIGGGTDITQRVQWSDTADPETWGSGNAGSVDLVEDGEDISGMAHFGDYICIHKKSSIYLGHLVNTTDIFRFDRKNTGAGTIANATIVDIPTGVQMFLAGDGLRSFNGITTKLVDSKVNDEIRTGLNTEFAHKSWAVLVQEEDEVWFGLPIGSQETGDTIYKYNYKNGVIYKDVRSNITAAWRATQSNSLSWNNTSGTWNSSSTRWNSNSLLSEFPAINISDNTGVTTQVDSNVNDDNLSAVTAFWESKDYEPQEKGRIGRWQRLETWAKGNTLKIEYSTDSGNTWTEVGDSPYTLTSFFPSDTAPIMSYFDELSSRLRIRYTNAVSGESCSVKQFILGYVDRELRK